MPSVPDSCRFFLQILRDLIDGVRAAATITGEPLTHAPRAMAQKMAAGLRMVERCVRTLLLVMALEFEHTLVEARRPLGRPHKRKVLVRPRRLKVLGTLFSFGGDDTLQALKDRPRSKAKGPTPAFVAVGTLNQRLEQLAAIVADPTDRARRLAYHLARNRPGPILAPDPTLRPPSHLRPYWRTEASASFSAMVHDIHTKSRARPPPQQPRRWHGPSVTALG
jgi:hypothetical protein